MGQLKLTPADLEALAAGYGPATPKLTVQTDMLELQGENFRLELTDATVTGRIEHRGVAFALKARYVDGELQVDFE